MLRLSIHQTIGFNVYQVQGQLSLTNSVLLNDTEAIHGGDPGHSYVDFYGNSSNGVTLGATDKTVDPGYDTATYGRGAYLFVPSSSTLKGAGSNGADIGANIIYEYVNGLLTNTPLWPWPMENRIMTEKGMSVTWAASGGIWKTLSGIYPSATVPGDCDGDGHVTVTDLSLLLSHFGAAYASCDFNADGIINILDLSTLLSNYGR